jgi:putative solute:sodium symporter small subunit
MNPSADNRAENSARERVRYWRANKIVVLCLLGVWFAVAYLLGIVFVNPLNRITLGGFPLGFWIAQQGSIFVFILLILIYCLVMEREDRKFHVEERRGEGDGA